MPPDAPLEDIGRSYKKLALKYHPDKTNHNPELTEKFKDATRAYEILRDPRKRQVYDAYGEDGLDGTAAASQPPVQPTGQSSRNGNQNGQFPFPQANNLFAQFFSDMNCVFSAGTPFNNSFGSFEFNVNVGDNTRKQVVPAPPDPDASRVTQGAAIHHTFKVTLSDMYYGKVVKFQLPRMTKCSTCNGAGCFNPRLCRICKGSGRVLVTMANQFSNFQEVSLCGPCHGRGTYYSRKDKCPNCENGYLVEKKIIKVNVLPGSKDGDKCILRGQADEGKNIIPGDVIIHLQALPHPFLVRRYNDLYMDHDIDLKTALLGGSVTIKDFVKPGEDLKILINAHGDEKLNDSVDPSIKQGEIVGTINQATPKIVKNLGMPINGSIEDGIYYQNSNMSKTFTRGNLFIRFNVQIPKLEDFASEEDIATLFKILPSKSAEPASKSVQEFHLSNLLNEVPLSRTSSHSSPVKRRTNDLPLNEYDYDNIDIDSNDEKEEVEDEAFYAGEWSKENPKKRKNNGGQAFDDNSGFTKVPC